MLLRFLVLIDYFCWQHFLFLPFDTHILIDLNFPYGKFEKKKSILYHIKKPPPARKSGWGNPLGGLPKRRKGCEGREHGNTFVSF